MSVRKRVAISLLVAIGATALSYWQLTGRGFLASDFQYPLRAARALLAGQNPYQVIWPTGPYPFEYFFAYTLPAALVALPFTPLDDYWAGALFFGLSAGLLAFAVYREPWRWPLFVSAPFLISASVAQWGPLLLAATMMPRFLGWLLVCKPTMGLACWIYRPSRRAALLGGFVAAIAIFILPSWPIWFLAVAVKGQDGRYIAPLLFPLGFLLLFAVLRWRTPEGRLLFTLALIPRHPYWYDGLPVWLVAKTWQQGLLLSALSWIAYLGWLRFTPPVSEFKQHLLSLSWQSTLIYLPALLLLLQPRLTHIAKTIHERLSSVTARASS